MQTAEQALPATSDEQRVDYVAPELRVLGDVRDLTLGTSPGVGDSGGSGSNFRSNARGAPRR